MIKHLQDRAVGGKNGVLHIHSAGVQPILCVSQCRNRQAQRDETHVVDRAISDQTLNIGLSKGRERP